jgi:hypothetical protein
VTVAAALLDAGGMFDACTAALLCGDDPPPCHCPAAHGRDHARRVLRQRRCSGLSRSGRRRSPACAPRCHAGAA